MDGVVRSSQEDVYIDVGEVKTRRLRFAIDLVLHASFETDLQCFPEMFTTEYDEKPSATTTFCCPLLRLTEKFNYLGVAFTSN
ncbi:unnamed protein product [Soboliphyme baturini]|uniref:Uncharacterized protein n=1 Tax=Soboliphyme baturini TaxID=241478 RepID=A0A183ID11_9BILA|nr:unnamed protein product [Soboliphyme baturini]